MSDEHLNADKGPSGMRMLHVQVTEDLDACGIGIYHVHENGHPDVPNSTGKQVGELLAAIRLENPDHCYEIAQKITMCGIKIEEQRKRSGSN